MYTFDHHDHGPDCYNLQLTTIRYIKIAVWSVSMSIKHEFTRFHMSSGYFDMKIARAQWIFPRNWTWSNTTDTPEVPLHLSDRLFSV